MSPTSFSFTVKARGGLLQALLTDCHFCPAIVPGMQPTQQPQTYEPFKAIWDTGATGTVITQDVVDKCGLRPIGMAQSHTVNGTLDTERYRVNLRLPNRVTIPNISVIRGNLGGGAQALIGMDIITLGDFSITNVGGVTVFSFRVPSEKTVDFVEEHQRQAARQGGLPPGGSPPKHFGMGKKRRR